MSDFTQDTSTQGTGGFTVSKTYNTIQDPNLAFHSRAGIYNSADNVIKFFTNNTDALTINSSGQVICNGSLITNLSWLNIDGKPSTFPSTWDTVSGKPTIFATNWDNVASKPSIFPTNWDNVASKPSIFPTNWDNVASKPVNFQTDWNTTVLNRPLIFTQAETSNIFVTSNVIQNTQDFINYSKLAGRPSLATVATSGAYTDLSGRPDIFTKTETSNIFITSNVLSNTSNSLYNNVNLNNYFTKTETSNIFTTNSNSSNFQYNFSNALQLVNNNVINNYYTKTQTSNIFVTSNVIQNSVGFIDYNNLANKPSGTDLSSYFTKTQTSNIFVTSNVIQNSVGFIDYNNLANKPTIGSGAGQFWSLDSPTNLIYNNNTNGTVVINGTTINDGYRFKVNGNIWCDGSNIRFASSTSGNLMRLSFHDSLTGYFGTQGCSIYKIPTHEFVIMNYTTSRLFFGVGGNIRAVLDNANNFSIGTPVSFPAARLHLNDVAGAEIKILMTDGNTGHTGTDGCAIIKQGDRHMNIMNYEANDIIFSTNGVERMRIYGNGGNVNITNTLVGNFNANSGSISTLASTTASITTINNVNQLNVNNITITGTLTLPFDIAIKTSDNLTRLYCSINGNTFINALTTIDFYTNNLVKAMTLNQNGQILLTTDTTVTTPQGMIHLHKGSSSGDAIVRLTDSASGSGATNGVVLWKETNNNCRLWNYQNANLIFGTNNAERVRIKETGYLGIGDTNCLGKLTIKSTYDNANDGIIINATDDGTANEKYMLKIYPYVVGSGLVGYKFRVYNSPSANYGTDAILLDSSGNLIVGTELIQKTNTWNRSSDLKNRFYFGNNARTYFGSQDGYEWRNNNDGTLVIMTNAGFLGLGVGVPSYRLHVASGTTTSGSATYRYFNAGTNITVATANFTDCCAYFGSTIVVASWIASSSDRRMKKEIKDIDKNEAIETLLKLKPKKYKYIDNIIKSNREVIGFVAQDVKEVIPDVVNDTNKEVIPNIYKCYYINDNIIATDEDLRGELKVGDKIEYLLENDDNRKQTTILEITDTYIKTDINVKNNTKIFIIGKEVNDFQTIAKEDIFSLNVCVTQELYKIIQDLKNRIEFLENKLNLIEQNDRNI